jgi:hypothetical protein
VAILDHHFPESKPWKLVFWTVLILLSVGGYLLSRKKAKQEEIKEEARAKAE